MQGDDPVRRPAARRSGLCDLVLAFLCVGDRVVTATASAGQRYRERLQASDERALGLVQGACAARPVAESDDAAAGAGSCPALFFPKHASTYAVVTWS